MIHKPTWTFTDKFLFFPKFLLTLALSVLVFAGQASAQGPSVSLEHVTDGTAGTVAGQGTTITVKISQTGVNDIPGIAAAGAIDVALAFDTSVVGLTAVPLGLLKADTATGATLTIPAPPGGTLSVPAEASLTFTTAVDVTDMEFSISITGAQVVSTAGIVPVPVTASVTFNSVRPPLGPPSQLHLDTQIESPAQNNSVLIFTDKRPGDTLQIQLFVPNAAGQNIQAFTLELALQGKTFAHFISSISGSDWTGGDLFPGTSVSDNPTLSGLFLPAETVPMTGYLGQIDLKVIGVLSDQDKLRVTSAFLAVAGGTLQSVDVSNAELSFTSVYICPGDFDDNGIVNMADFLLIGEVFGTRSGDAAYNALMDMDSSGGIDVADFLLFVDVFDTTCKPPGGGGPTGVSIPDANLRAIIEDKLGKASGAPITPVEMTSLTRLDAPNLNISDLKGLEFATGLTRLDLGYEVVDNTIVNSNSISDISPLSNLTNLTWLNLSSNSISDVSALSNLTNLTVLSLYGNNVSGISSLSGLTSLAWLQLSRNKISAIKPLSGFTGLTNLYLRFNSISDISPLSSLTNLRVLFLDGNQLTGSIPSWLGSLTNLQSLGLSDNAGLSGPLPDSFTSLASLQYLYLADTGLCAPTDEAFQAWLEGIENKSGVVDCGDGSGTPKMYWTDYTTDKIQRSNLDGSNVEDLVILTTRLRGGPLGIALDVGNSKMYWTDYGTDKIQRSNLDGSNVEDLVTGLSHSQGIALDVGNSKMYWTDYGTGKIQRSNLDGSNVEDLVTGLRGPFGIALDVNSDKMYWTDRSADKIQRSNLDGSNVEDLVTGLSDPVGIALDVGNSKMYWGDDGVGAEKLKIQRSNLDGSNVEDLVTTGLSDPFDIALDVGNSKMYWTNGGKIRRSNLDGTNVEDLVTGLGNSHGIALDISGRISGGNGSTSVTIPDANLRAVIEDNLGKVNGVPITRAEMESLTRLEARNSNISDLTGRESTGRDLYFRR
ncbi:MAG: leucine-rich repeat domain-containing protein [Gemmatimonadetes bacterium]|nr:leucine-rich repeat domain-containing protein [Gemmatimonadota bacterium]